MASKGLTASCGARAARLRPGRVTRLDDYRITLTLVGGVGTVPGPSGIGMAPSW
jgi:hypothetical protein